MTEPSPENAGASRAAPDDPAGERLGDILSLLRCPVDGGPLEGGEGATLKSRTGREYPLSDGIACFTEYHDGQADPDDRALYTADAARQREHYDAVADLYVANIHEPHTKGYMGHLDDCLMQADMPASLGVVAELCCGKGEAMVLLGERISIGIGLDISGSMLRHARRSLPSDSLFFVQGDATDTPLADSAFDHVFMLGGVHHINDREALFTEVARILKPGGVFYFREPLDDFWLWRQLRAIVYRLSPALDSDTERPLRREPTIAALEGSGLRPSYWRSHGFIGFCLFMNSDVLVFNRVLRHVPGIERIARWAARADDALLRLPGLRGKGLQVIGAAEKPPGEDIQPDPAP